jgi:hypothetical protein
MGSGRSILGESRGRRIGQRGYIARFETGLGGRGADWVNARAIAWASIASSSTSKIRIDLPHGRDAVSQHHSSRFSLRSIVRIDCIPPRPAAPPSGTLLQSPERPGLDDPPEAAS